MHGTQLNGRRIVARQDIPLSPGDILSFGNKVSRGDGRYDSRHCWPGADSLEESFFPVDVRFDCRWHGYVPCFPQTGGRPGTKPTSVTTEHRSTRAGPVYSGINTFSVPDDDDENSDDGVVVTGSRSVHKVDPTRDSDSESVSEDSNQALDSASPATSPEAEAKQKPGNSRPANSDTDTTVAPVSTESPRLPAESSPPGAFPEYRDASEGVESKVNEGSDNGSEFEVSNDSEATSESESEDDHQALDYNDRPMSLSEFNSQPPASPWSSAPAATAAGSKPLGGNTRPSYTSQPDPRDTVQSSQPPSDSMYPADMTQARPPAAPAGYQPPWPDFTFRVPSPSDKAMAKPANHHNYGYPEFPATFDPWAVPYPSSINYSGYRPGPVNPRLQPLDEQFSYAAQRPSSHSSPSSNVANASASPVLPHATDADRSDAAPVQPRSDERKTASTGSTRLAISDIVDKLSSESHPPGSSNRLKRKAAEYEADLGESSGRADESQVDSLPDAQPQPDLSAITIAESQLREIKSLVEQRRASAMEHRCKRAKTGVSLRSIAKYAGAAAVGAVIGSFTTIAALSALPAEYFEQR